MWKTAFEKLYHFNFFKGCLPQFYILECFASYIKKRIFLVFETLHMKSSLSIYYKIVIVKYPKRSNLFSRDSKNIKNVTNIEAFWDFCTPISSSRTIFGNWSVFVWQNDTNIFSVSLRFGAYHIMGQWGEFIKKWYLMLSFTFLAFYNKIYFFIIFTSFLMKYQISAVEY